MLGTRPLGWLDLSLSVSLFLFSFWCIQHLVDKVKTLIRTKFPCLLLWSLFRTAVNNAVARSFHSVQMMMWDICNINIYIKHYPLSSWLRMRSLHLAEMHLQCSAASSLQAPALFKLPQSIIKEWVSLQKKKISQLQIVNMPRCHISGSLSELHHTIFNLIVKLILL